MSEHLSKKLTIMSIFASVLVVFIHAYNLVEYNVTSGACYWIEEFISQFLARVAVPYFFMSSAFFLYRKERCKVIPLYKSKFKSTVIPYFFWNIIYMIAFIILGALSLTNTGRIDITVKNILGGIFLYKYNYTFWFMYELILLLVLYPIIVKILDKKALTLIIICIAFFIYMFFGNISYLGDYRLISLDTLVYYLSGAFLGKYYQKDIENTVNMKIGKKTILTLSSLCVSLAMFFVGLHIEINFSIIQNVLLLFSIYLILDFVVSDKTVRNTNLSFLIYCMHPLILEIVQKIVYKTLGHTQVIAMVDYIFSPIVTISVIYIVIKILKKVPVIYGLACGGRV